MWDGCPASGCLVERSENRPMKINVITSTFQGLLKIHVDDVEVVVIQKINIQRRNTMITFKYLLVISPRRGTFFCYFYPKKQIPHANFNSEVNECNKCSVLLVQYKTSKIFTNFSVFEFEINSLYKSFLNVGSVLLQLGFPLQIKGFALPEKIRELGNPPSGVFQ